MKTKILLIGALLASSIISAQSSFPHLAPSLGGNAERVASFGVQGQPNEFLEITNSTEFAGQFIPSIWAHHQADNRFVLRHFATTNSTQDNGTIPMMIFRAEIRNGLNLTAPNGTGEFPWGTTSALVTNRPLFAWENGNTQIMRILANGNVGVGTTTPTTRFHTFGGLRFENIPTVTTNTYVLTADANGVVSRQLSTSFGGGGLANSCNTTNFLTKRGTTSLTCSQIFDNGISVGVGTSTNFAYNTSGLATTTTGYTTGTLKLNIAGVTRGNVFISTSDQSYKLDVNPIQDALGSLLKMKGVTYKWDVANNPDMNFDSTDHSGLIAQQVEEVLPHLVYNVVESEEDRKGKKAVNYIELIPYLIEAIKTQQEQIVALQGQVNSSFQKQNSDLINLKNTKIISVSPNPSSDVIVISLNIDEDVKDAKIIVYDLSGKLMSSINVKERKNDITKSLQKDNFGSGTYIVSLLINGKSLDSKKIIFN
jgi:hypothetical protein